MQLDKQVSSLLDMPYTMSYVIRRRQLIDKLQELPKEEQPPQSLYFDDAALEEWFNRRNSGAQNIINLQIDDIEG